MGITFGSNSDYSLTAEEAIKKVRRGKSLEEEEYDNMKVSEQLKFIDMLYDEGMVDESTKRAGEQIKKYIEMGVVKPDDTGKESERKIDAWLFRSPAG